MTKSKVLTIAVILLLVINMALIAFIVTRSGRHKPVSPKEVIIKTLELDKNQVAAYEELVVAHQESVAELDAQLIETKKQLFSLLKDNDYNAKETQVLADLSALQSEIELTHMAHFRDIKALCNADQKEKFNTLADKIQQLFKRGPKKPKKH